mmetsp:Transcript_16615/g.38162  ORF Transcript_16615/g.38162 Transcript_16615/m.38162 type:complete len:100 (-) Transcript_16615:406-705(-)
MTVTGRLVEIHATQQVSDTSRKRLFVIEYVENPQYPEYFSLELTQDRCDLLDDFQLGQAVRVSFHLKGRRWMNPEGGSMYFNVLQAWSVEAVTPYRICS